MSSRRRSSLIDHGSQGDRSSSSSPPARSSQTFIGAKHRARLARKDKPVAITATARELACLIYLMVTRGEEYVEQGMEVYEKRRLNRTFANLDRRAKQLGYQLVQIVENDEEQEPARPAA